ncbi:hypothetical protein BDF20DRAFT_581511 [Mycotypha africana]|uniref:uncharacterized protein n=1 Tax=Mycotypha africana TaxID=64632 RepID=UPI0023000F7E|nr:uncharacterized protein BDF20DRAFT_581511 [Mycotypha africana]KAI8977684.1 hypothetical protein BDF20DRAFT_581511 [Mycotypha africana]
MIYNKLPAPFLKPSAPPPAPALATFPTESMDIDVNAQKYGRSYDNYKKANYKKCDLCNRNSHWTRECYYLNKAHEEMKRQTKRPTNKNWNHRSNVQAIASPRSGSTPNLMRTILFRPKQRTMGSTSLIISFISFIVSLLLISKKLKLMI